MTAVPPCPPCVSQLPSLAATWLEIDCTTATFLWVQSSKYCLFNRWKTPEPCDDSLTILTRRYLTIALVIHIVVSLQFYAGWPFDGLCPTADVRYAFGIEKVEVSQKGIPLKSIVPRRTARGERPRLHDSYRMETRRNPWSLAIAMQRTTLVRCMLRLMSNSSLPSFVGVRVAANTIGEIP